VAEEFGCWKTAGDDGLDGVKCSLLSFINGFQVIGRKKGSIEMRVESVSGLFFPSLSLSWLLFSSLNTVCFVLKDWLAL